MIAVATATMPVENLWESLLRDSSKRTSSSNRQSSSSNIIVLGDNPNLQMSVIQALSQSKPANLPSASYPVNESIVDYQYFMTEDGSVVNLWTFDSLVWGSGESNDLEFIYNSATNEQIMFAVVLDLSKPSDTVMTSLMKGISSIKAHSAKLKKVNGATYSSERDQSISSYMAQIKKASTAESKSETETSFHNFGFPILVIGMYGDTWVTEDLQELQRLKPLQGQIRKICLDIGAACLMNTGSVNAKDKKFSDQSIAQYTTAFGSKLRKYVIHRLLTDLDTNYNDLQKEDLGLGVFIPAGIDSLEFIAISTGFKANAALSKLEYNESHEAAESANMASAQVELESERDWLQNLQSFVNQITATTVSASSASNAEAGNDVGAHGLSRSVSEFNVTSALSSDESLPASRGRLSIDPSMPTNDSKVRPPLTGTNLKSTRSLRGPVGEQNKQEVTDFFKNLASGTTTKPANKK